MGEGDFLQTGHQDFLRKWLGKLRQISPHATSGNWLGHHDIDLGGHLSHFLSAIWIVTDLGC